MSGSVSWIFTRMARFEVPLRGSEDDGSEKQGLNEEELFELALDAGAEDIEADEENGVAQVFCPATAFKGVEQALEKAMGETPPMEMVAIPNNTVDIAGQEAQESFAKFINAVEDQDDVQRVYHNANMEASET